MTLEVVSDSSEKDDTVTWTIDLENYYYVPEFVEDVDYEPPTQHELEGPLYLKSEATRRQLELFGGEAYFSSLFTA